MNEKIEIYITSLLRSFQKLQILKKSADFLNSTDLGLDYYRMFSKMKHPLLEVNQFD